ncbi:MAG TPA: Mut7-C RNAse domain-containing protein [Candidatus Bathyarchaeia archaeon]|nr:Mut7-C RNAse domain-containing protein [Candidatus Bathyarchaeia archaeon]
MIEEDDTREEKFIVDTMYQRIARWLRVLGYDTELVTVSVDYKVIKKAIEEHRILITRDEDLRRRAEKLGVKVLTIDGETIEERLAELHKEIGIKLFLSKNSLPRCSICNGEITVIEKNEIDDRIPEGTKKQYNEFYICLNEKCKQVYWEGSHWSKIVQSLKESRRIIGEELGEDKKKLSKN